MRAAIKRTSTAGQVILPPAALAALEGSEEVDVWVLRKGVVLLTESGALERWDEKREGGEEKEKPPLAAAGQTKSEGYAPGSVSARNTPVSDRPTATAQLSKKSQTSVLSPDEMSMLRKLLTIRFEERTVPAVAKKIGAAEKKVLDALVARRLIEVFKNSKYREGVYNISQGVYEAVSTPMSGEKRKENAAQLQPQAEKTNAHSSPPLAFSNSSSGTPPINSADHLARFGYMVLNSEGEAKMAMMQIQPMLKTDDVRGIRGFDKRYYVLRRSFLHQYAGLVLAQLDAGPSTADKIAAALGLASEAVSVILMIMADEGEVIEKRRGMWERA